MLCGAEVIMLVRKDKNSKVFSFASNMDEESRKALLQALENLEATKDQVQVSSYREW